MEQKFYKCEHCGNIIAIVKSTGVPVMCCGQKMTEIVPNTVEASGEKHTPVWRIEGSKVHVNVGSIAHPMLDEHYIEWVYLQTNQGGQRKLLHPGEKPQVVFSLTQDDFPIAAYAYCNLHGLWMTKF